MSGLDWIAVDWGTSHLRAWGLADKTVLRHAQSDHGMSRLTRPEFEGAILKLIGDWLPWEQVTPIIACGMVGSRQGWVEAPYRTVPCVPLSDALVAAPVRDLRITVHIVPGLKQARPADVMRGEETQIAGFLELNPGWDGVVCLPGTHCKWVHLSAGEIVSFQTFLTGEMFSLLSEHSVLRHSLEGWNASGFDDGLKQGMDRPEWALARLFTLRAESLLSALPPDVARARLSGLLIGAELAAAKPYWLGQRVAVIGEDALAHTYKAALETLSVPVTCHDATAITLAGLAAARRNLPEDIRSCVN